MSTYAVAAPKRILICRLGHIGDVVMATPLATALRRRWPEAHIAWLVEPPAAPLLERHEDIDEIIVWERRVLRDLARGRGLMPYAAGLIRFVRALRRRGFGLAIDAHGMLRSAALIWAAGIPRRVGFCGGREGASWFYTDRVRRAATMNIGNRLRSLLTPLGIDDPLPPPSLHVTPEEREEAASWLRDNGARPLVVALAPGTTRAAKHWTPAGWAAVAAHVIERGGTPLLLGGTTDVALADEILARTGERVVNAVGCRTLRQSAALVAQADALVCVDTGLLHVAEALGTRTVGLFGASEWPLFTGYRHLEMVNLHLPCSPCACRPTCDGFPCMIGITPALVIAALDRALARRAPLVCLRTVS